MVLIVLPLTLLLVLGARDVSAKKPCAVDCAHYGTLLGNLADDPVDCHKYYICFDKFSWSEYSFDCPADEKFDTNLKKCKDPSESNFECTPPCEKCTYDCGSNILGKASNQFDCSIYYLCDAFVETKECPSSEPYFDGNKCQSNKDLCCTCKSSCTLTNAGNHDLIADYHNCTNYYLCIEEGIQDESTHGHCPHGNFEPMTGHCVEGAPCFEYPLCNK